MSNHWSEVSKKYRRELAPTLEKYLQVPMAVALSAQRDKIFRGIISEQAARLDVMHLKVPYGPAVLATPPISP